MRPTLVLSVLCLLLGMLLFYRHSQAVKQKKLDAQNLIQFSNNLAQTSARLAEQQVVNQSLETNLTVRRDQLQDYSNQLAAVSNILNRVQSEARQAASAAQAEVASRDTKINALESERDDLTKRMGELNSSLTNLENQISATEKKLAASEGDREFLLKELKRMQTEKAELERQFNDLAVLREQVHKLKTELSIARRLDWIRRGLYGEEKGGARLQQGLGRTPARPKYDLNVELSQTGSVKIVPPATNAPAAPKSK